jgi:hypothetical protein
MVVGDCVFVFRPWFVGTACGLSGAVAMPALPQGKLKIGFGLLSLFYFYL